MKQAKAATCHRRQGILGAIWTLFWTLFWIGFGLSFAFGGDEFRHTWISVVTGFGHAIASFFTGLLGSVGAVIQ